MKHLVKNFARRVLACFGTTPAAVLQGWNSLSLKLAMRQQELAGLAGKLRAIVPDIRNQESRDVQETAFLELKRRALHAFQCSLMQEALCDAPEIGFFVVNIGDSAGTHMRYLRGLLPPGTGLETMSVNLDPRAVDKIRQRGLPAMLCRAEELCLDRPIHLFVSFEMVEHLHNPAIFFRRLSRQGKGKRLALTVPFLRQSRVGLDHVRRDDGTKIYAEDEHIFELSPADWTLLIAHAGWKVVSERVYYQYPRRIPILSEILAAYWRWFDYEGFWGVILEPDPTYADAYLDWED